ncbi:hypothetical protein [Croceitalea sp. P059]|uniref:hypothetical protein n=1 Tax=Croceitalea sp. P059 TaxID=3075601 RepID=UPI00288875AA|nr:hypothetical protein [Croceitalea sp. P059]MDT0540686.1 hypothetical protein [Croceitalea sp. P059]
MTQNRKKISLIGILTLFTLFASCGGSYESENREKLISSFQDNFGFEPPKSVEKIKLKNWGLYDTDVHWMAFTFDPTVMEKIIKHDQPLGIALYNTSEFTKIKGEIKKSVNNPKWLELPDKNTEQVYYKMDFIERKSFSEYYLWTNTKSQMTYLFVHSFY